MPRTKVVFFKNEDASVPVLDWLDSLPIKVRVKCRSRIERLRELGHELRRPEADYLRDKIYEMRIGFQGDNYRMLYFFHGDIAAVVALGLIKERDVPPKLIDEAVKRKRAFEKNPAKHSHEEH